MDIIIALEKLYNMESIEIMPPVIEKISCFTPTRWAMQSIIDIQQGRSIKDIYKYLFVILLGAVAFFVIGIYKTSRKEKKFSIIQINYSFINSTFILSNLQTYL
ncbi:hypothetical protein [Clostridium gasigenes]|uniref:hypothetical protein n=1 Tax=Clostridium gasigenes TaxID=94869 RepID=UPI001C0DAEDE|nr:hypothetical protein [Clostridium gasigenes]MBU3104208.1 hypothetical protein [Clostridium gasigenes]MBU3132602.1 hypothetical protein [Clostridium gasigenes]